jgi:hypothetical protein
MVFTINNIIIVNFELRAGHSSKKKASRLR